jgi:ribonuclease R
VKSDLRSRLLHLLGSPKYQPLDKVELSKKLGLPPDKRVQLRDLLRTLEQQGTIARIRKDRYVIPHEANLCTGVLHVHANGSAHMECVDGGEEIYIPAENTGTAMNRDRVVARLVHEGVRQRRDGRDQRTGQVIRILVRANETIVGTLQRPKQFFYVAPDDPKLVHHICVRPPRDSAAPALPIAEIGDKVVVRLDEWTNRNVSPEGEIIEVLGPASKPGVDILSIIRKHHLPLEFPAPVLREAERIDEEIEEREIERREDLRAMRIVTIDPDDAKDFDDAVHVERLVSKGGAPTGWRLGVHIADVSHYVRPGGPLDREAFQRGNSVYLVDRVVPMLPEKLSNGICSLKPGVDRLVQSVFIDFNRDGRIRSARFGSSVIRSAARLTYKQAFAILKQPVNGDPIAERLHVAWELASLLRKRRFEAGSLDLDFPEVKVWLDEDKRPIRLEKVENDISHQLIEEFMLAANEVVAREIKQRLVPSVYRIHEKPDPEKLGEYREFAQSYGYKVGDLTVRGEVQRLLASIRGKAGEHALKLGFLKSIKRASYAVNPVGHYGLAKVNYTHFTSPIRRYADLIVHRILRGLTEPHARIARPAPVDLNAASEHISSTERTAADAEKESVKLKKIEFFQNQIRSRKPQDFQAVIVDVRSYGLLVELPEFVLTGLIHVSSLQDDFYIFDPVRLRFTGRRRRRTFTIGDSLPVIVSRVDVGRQQIDFVPAEKGERVRR